MVDPGRWLLRRLKGNAIADVCASTTNIVPIREALRKLPEVIDLSERFTSGELDRPEIEECCYEIVRTFEFGKHSHMDACLMALACILEMQPDDWVYGFLGTIADGFDMSEFPHAGRMAQLCLEKKLEREGNVL